MNEHVAEILQQVDRLTPREFEEFLDGLIDVTLARQEQAEDADSAAVAKSEAPIPSAGARNELGL
jgi:hypothetical protein